MRAHRLNQLPKATQRERALRLEFASRPFDPEPLKNNYDAMGPTHVLFHLIYLPFGFPHAAKLHAGIRGDWWAQKSMVPRKGLVPTAFQSINSFFFFF